METNPSSPGRRAASVVAAPVIQRGISLSGGKERQTFPTASKGIAHSRKKAASWTRRGSYKSSGPRIHFIIVWKSSELYETELGFLFMADRNF